jgi:hypothetical protein
MIPVEKTWLFVARLMLKDYSYRKQGPGHRATERPYTLSYFAEFII